MNNRMKERTLLGLTQLDAASQAGLSLATWRRWEDNPDSVSTTSRRACEHVLEGRDLFPFRNSEFAAGHEAAAFAMAWKDSQRLTPRQAYTLASVLDNWGYFLEDSLREPRPPLHEVDPFNLFDLRVMMHVQDNSAWATAVRCRCHAVADELSRGVLPFDRSGPFIDEVLIGAALGQASPALEDLSVLIPEVIEQLPSRESYEDPDQGVYLIGDDDWDILIDTFDTMCRWEEWRFPLYDGHPLLPGFLASHHPFTWFDLDTGVGFAISRS